MGEGFFLEGLGVGWLSAESVRPTVLADLVSMDLIALMFWTLPDLAFWTLADLASGDKS